nr:hypothetical protein [Bacillus pumilus]
MNSILLLQLTLILCSLLLTIGIIIYLKHQMELIILPIQHVGQKLVHPLIEKPSPIQMNDLLCKPITSNSRLYSLTQHVRTASHHWNNS